MRFHPASETIADTISYQMQGLFSQIGQNWEQSRLIYDHPELDYEKIEKQREAFRDDVLKAGFRAVSKMKKKADTA